MLKFYTRLLAICLIIAESAWTVGYSVIPFVHYHCLPSPPHIGSCRCVPDAHPLSQYIRLFYLIIFRGPRHRTTGIYRRHIQPLSAVRGGRRFPCTSAQMPLIDQLHFWASTAVTLYHKISPISPPSGVMRIGRSLWRGRQFYIVHM